MKKPEYILFDRDTRAIIYNFQERAIQRMIDFDSVCRRDTPSVAAIVQSTRSGNHKAFWGNTEIFIPIYKTIAESLRNHPEVDVMINYASFRSAYPSTKEALETSQIKTIAIIAEGIPERKSRELAALAKKRGKWIIGPATVGGLVAGAFKIGNTAGSLDNILASRLHRPGSVAFVSKSGGMLNELNNIISRNTDGVYEGIAIGGDRYPGSTFIDHIMRFERNPEIKMIILLGEVGGEDEYLVVKALKEKKITKPLVSWIIGTCSKSFPSEVQFGHAGARADVEKETADAKLNAFREVGAIVPSSFEDFDGAIKRIYDEMVSDGKLIPKPDLKAPTMPMDYNEALKMKLIRRPTNFVSTISDERGEELMYGPFSISEVLENNIGIGGVLSLLWFKKLLPIYAINFIELVIQITADHGPAVSGAHNAIVAARAGKDVISSLVSGLLTIGTRFGGAIDGAAQMFSSAYDRGLTPEEFVNEMKTKNVNIPGIGHRVKSVDNPDVRVLLIKEYVKENFRSTELLNYALEVEKITTMKRNNLILNVDGCIGICFVDLLRSCGEFTKSDIDMYIQLGALNGLFVIGRSIGLIGHIIDQKRLKQPLYRHPWDDIAYMLEEKS